MNRLIQLSYSCFAMTTILGLAAEPPVALGQQALLKTAAITQNQQSSQPLDTALGMARESLQHIRANVSDYTALFVKRYRVDGELTEMQYANVKIRNRKTREGRITTPMAVYLDFLKPESVKGREVVWVDGQNNGKLIAHDTGLRSLINVKLDPNGYVAMRGQRHPITEIGTEKLAQKMIETVQRDRPHGECQVEFFRNVKVSETACTMLQIIHPAKREHFDFYCARMYFDERLNIPIRYESWSWPVTPGGKPVLEEEYTYFQMKVNVGLTDQDFSTGNPEYGFQ